MKKCIHPVYLIFVCTLNMRSVGEMKHCFSFASFKSWCLFLILVNEECNGWKKYLHHCQDKVASSTHFSTKRFETRPGDVSSWACSHALATGHCASGVSANGLALAGQLERKGSWGKLSEVLWKSGDQPGDHWLLLLPVISFDQKHFFGTSTESWEHCSQKSGPFCSSTWLWILVLHCRD